jgi:two-component system nitrogen regulation sensor histidine kinase GlnL
MKASRALQEKVLGNLTAAVFLVTQKGEICYMNQAAESILGMSFKRAEGTEFFSLLSMPDEDGQAIENATNELRPFTRRQAKVRDTQGVEKTVDYSVIPLDADEGGYMLVEIRELDRLMKINREEQQIAAHDTTRQLVRGLAHEVKNPLGGILGAAQLLHQELEEPELQEYTSVITEETNRLRNLVDRMLGPNQRPQFHKLNVHEVLERVATLLGAETRGKVRIVKDYDPSVPEVYIDSEQLIQAVLNVARNALEALIDTGTADPEIILRSRVHYRFTLGHVQHSLIARIDIIDNGPGIDENMLDEIFYPMISGRDKGTGLGLSIAQSIINVHKGLIECSSQPGETQFSIYLPIADGPQVPDDAH